MRIKLSVLRGGSWGLISSWLRAANRDIYRFRPDLRGNGLGFRFVLRREKANER